ncbi:MAG: efflux RND transporter periplasmic adaptor subunit [Sphaerochaetaceae bacterium]|nr:efflux RND transporter periplasmic adaptor subunit [Sphaerochaetaceae bacterium]
MKRFLGYLSFSILILIMLTSCIPGQDEGVQESSEEMASASWVVDPDGVTEFSSIVSQTAEVKKRALREYVYASAPVRGVNEAVLRADVPGTIERIDVNLGDTVQKEDILVTLASGVSSLTVQQLEAQRDTLLRQMDAQKVLYDRGSVSQSALSTTESSLKGIEAQLESAQDTLSSSFISSPIAGRIGYLDDSLVIGTTVSPNQMIARVVDNTRMKLIFSVGESQLFQIKEGYSATVTISTQYDRYQSEGVVTAISAASDESTGSWRVMVEADNPDPDLIRAGISADIAIFNSDAPLQFVVPNSAMVYRNGMTYVYLLESENTAKLLEVNLLDTYGDYTAISSVDEAVDLNDREVLVTRLDSIQSGDVVVTRE